MDHEPPIQPGGGQHHGQFRKSSSAGERQPNGAAAARRAELVRRPGSPVMCAAARRARAGFLELVPTALDDYNQQWSGLERRLGAARGLANCADWHVAVHAAFASDERWLSVIGVDGCDAPVFGSVLRPTQRNICGVVFPILETPVNKYIPISDIAIVPSAPEAVYDLRRELSRRPGLRWSILMVRRVPNDGLLLAAVRETAPGWAVVRDDEPCFTFASRTRSENRDLVSKNFRKNLRHAHNELAAMSGVRFESVRCYDLLPRALDTFLDVEASGWKGRADSSIRSIPAALRFYTELMTRFGPKGQCEVNLLWADGNCIAALFGLVINGRTYLLKIGYDERYAAAAPGHLMIEWLLDRCATEEGRGEVCITSRPDWLRSWRPEPDSRVTVYIFNRTPLGWAARLAMRVRARRAVSKSTDLAFLEFRR